MKYPRLVARMFPNDLAELRITLGSTVIELKSTHALFQPDQEAFDAMVGCINEACLDAELLDHDPDLLEACKNLLRTLDGECIFPGTASPREDQEEAKRKARAAIARVEGK